MLKKNYYIGFILMLFLYNNNLLAQDYLGNYHIVHKSGKKHNTNPFKWMVKTYKTNSLYRNAEFDLKFADNCKYILPNSYYQLYLQKVIKLTTLQNNETKNSLRVGWCYNPETDKIMLSFYAHINHLEEPWGDSPGREHCLLNVNINTGEWVHVKMAISKFGMFMSINDQSVVVSRNIFSWSPGGEITYFKANSYFENHVKSGGAVQDMDFYISNAVVDNPDFPWPDPGTNCNFTAENIKFMNANFSEPEQNYQTYYAGNNIFCSEQSASAVPPDRLPYEVPFTVIEDGLNVVFSAGNSILLKEHFIAREGSDFIAKIETVTPPMPIIIVSEPSELLPVLNYEIENATTVYTSLYPFNSDSTQVFSGQASFDENNQASIQVTNFDDLSAGKYYISNLYVNDCYRNSSEYLILKINNSTKQSNKNKLLSLSKETQNVKNKLTILSDKEMFSDNENSKSLAITSDLNNNVINYDIHIFPNPSTGKYTVQSVSTVSSVYVYDLQGKLVIKKEKINRKSFTFDLSNHKSGIFYLKITTGENVNTFKVIKF